MEAIRNLLPLIPAEEPVVEGRANEGDVSNCLILPRRHVGNLAHHRWRGEVLRNLLHLPLPQIIRRVSIQPERLQHVLDEARGENVIVLPR